MSQDSSVDRDPSIENHGPTADDNVQTVPLLPTSGVVLPEMVVTIRVETGEAAAAVAAATEHDDHVVLVPRDLEATQGTPRGRHMVACALRAAGAIFAASAARYASLALAALDPDTGELEAVFPAATLARVRRRLEGWVLAEEG